MTPRTRRQQRTGRYGAGTMGEGCSPGTEEGKIGSGIAALNQLSAGATPTLGHQRWETQILRPEQ